MPRKKPVTADSIQNWKPSEYQVRRGRQVFASRLCKQGKFEQAKEYCAKVGIPFPPFSEGVLSQGAKELSDLPAEGHVQKGVPSEEHFPPQPLVTGPEAPAGDVRAAIGHEAGPVTLGAVGEANAARVELPAPAISPMPKPLPPGVQRATIEGFCLNKRLLSIKLQNGEWASMWKDRQSYRLGEEVDVVLERGTLGINAMYQEVRNPI